HDDAAWVVDVTDRLLVTGGRDATARLRRLDHPESPSWPRVLAGHGSSVGHAAISPDGRWLATGAQHGTGRLGGPAGGLRGEPSLQLPGKGWVIGLAFTKSPLRLLVGRRDGVIEVWDPASRPLKAPEKTTTVPTRVSSFLAATADGSLIAIDDDKGAVHLW